MIILSMLYLTIMMKEALYLESIIRTIQLLIHFSMLGEKFLAILNFRNDCISLNHF